MLTPIKLCTAKKNIKMTLMMSHPDYNITVRGVCFLKGKLPQSEGMEQYRLGKTHR